MRKTKIVATIGPATATPERLRELISAGADALAIISGGPVTDPEFSRTGEDYALLSAQVDLWLAVPGQYVARFAADTRTRVLRAVPRGDGRIDTNYAELKALPPSARMRRSLQARSSAG